MKLKVKCTHCGKVHTQEVSTYTLDYELTCKKCGKDGTCKETK